MKKYDALMGSKESWDRSVTQDIRVCLGRIHNKCDFFQFIPGRDQVIESFKSFPVEINAGQFWNKTRFTETRPLFGFRKD